MAPAITRKMLWRETLKDPVMQQQMEDIGRGECKPALHRYKGFVDYLTVEDKEPQLLIPRGLQTEVIHLAHKRYQRPDRTVGLLCHTCLFYDIGNRIK